MRLLLYSILLLIPCSSALAQSKADRILTYTDSVMDKKVSRGECWDLVAGALDYVEADWNPPLEFGEEILPKKQKIKAGDIITFKNVRFDLPTNEWLTFGEHFAIVYEAKENNTIIIAHQNHNNIRKVKLLELNLDYQTKGKIQFYRPKG